MADWRKCLRPPLLTTQLIPCNFVYKKTLFTDLPWFRKCPYLSGAAVPHAVTRIGDSRQGFSADRFYGSAGCSPMLGAFKT